MQAGATKLPISLEETKFLFIYLFIFNSTFICLFIFIIYLYISIAHTLNCNQGWVQRGERTRRTPLKLEKI